MTDLPGWHTWGVNERGEPSTVFRSQTGLIASLHRNELYVDNTKERDLCVGYLIQIQSGCLSYKDLHIQATRGPGDGIYAVAYTTIYEQPTIAGCLECEALPAHNHVVGCSQQVGTHILGMVGYGVYKDQPEYRRFLLEWVTNDDLVLPDELRNPTLLRALRGDS